MKYTTDINRSKKSLYTKRASRKHFQPQSWCSNKKNIRAICKIKRKHIALTCSFEVEILRILKNLLKFSCRIMQLAKHNISQNVKYLFELISDKAHCVTYSPSGKKNSW